MKKAVCLTLVVMMVFLLSFSAVAKVTYTYGDWKLQNTGLSRYAIDSYLGADADATIPSDYMGAKITGILSYAFVSNGVIRSITMNRDMRTIGSDVFAGESLLEKVALNELLFSIGSGAFSGTTSLSSVNLEDTSITAVQENTFLDSGIISIALPDTCTSVGFHAFAQCSSLEKLVIPASVTEIDADAFTGSDKLVIYCYADSYAHQYAEEKGITYVLIEEESPTEPPTQEPTTAPTQPPTEEPTQEPTIAPEPVTYMLGDADGDGEVTVFDATVIQRIAIFMYVDDKDGAILRGDVDGDGVTDGNDVALILRYALGIHTPYEIGESTTVYR